MKWRNFDLLGDRIVRWRLRTRSSRRMRNCAGSVLPECTAPNVVISVCHFRQVRLQPLGLHLRRRSQEAVLGVRRNPGAFRSISGVHPSPISPCVEQGMHVSCTHACSIVYPVAASTSPSGTAGDPEDGRGDVAQVCLRQGVGMPCIVDTHAHVFALLTYDEHA